MRIIDRLATFVITAGGMMVITAILGICLFLAWVVVPLFAGASAGEARSYALFEQAGDDVPVLTALDEYLQMGAVLHSNGELAGLDAATGQVVERRQIFEPGRQISAWSRALQGGHTALALDDGSVLVGHLDFRSESSDSERTTRLDVELAPAGEQWSGGAPLVAMDYRVQLEGDRKVRELLAGVSADGRLLLGEIRRRVNLLTGEERTSVKRHELPYDAPAEAPRFLLLEELGSTLYLAWDDGRLRRYDVRRPQEAVLAEELDLTPGPERLTGLDFLLGGRSLIAGDSGGGVRIWFCIPAEDRAQYPDGQRLTAAHVLEPHTAAITAVAGSPRNRCLVTGDSAGKLVLRHATSERTLLELRPHGSGAVIDCLISPKADAVAALTASGVLTWWPLRNPHPQTTLATVFGPVWYEGYEAPSMTWQSTGGSDEFEPKLGLAPLIFGTFKATIYSMLFAVPIAVLAAIYTSQFLHPRQRGVVKPVIEMMASLPSVVLGFVAALVLAPVVEHHLTAVLLLIPALPLLVWLAGHLVQLKPEAVVHPAVTWLRVVAAVGVLGAGVLVCFLLAPAVERAVFDGNIMNWLDGRTGTAAPLWGAVLFPIVFAGLWVCHRQWLRPVLEDLPHGEALSELGAVCTLVVAAAVISGLAGAGLSDLGFDLRGELAGTYVQRNTLIVGFVMGFAVIPIIYTIAEDALSSVPAHLVAGSLACGASQWQTTVRVVMPVAMSGIYSAVLIGLGRAVGETMIVVMAAGNTPIMDWSPFNGLRALSANIAVELPEAVKDGTLYRVLFLAGLVLFFMTFLINTVAELVRLRLRRRAARL